MKLDLGPCVPLVTSTSPLRTRLYEASARLVSAGAWFLLYEKIYSPICDSLYRSYCFRLSDALTR